MIVPGIRKRSNEMLLQNGYGLLCTFRKSFPSFFTGREVPKLLLFCIYLTFSVNNLQARVSIPGFTQSPDSGNQTRFWLDTWGVDDGLPQSWVLDIAQDNDGYLWVGTLSGFVRFDGFRFVNFRMGEHPSILDDTVNAIQVDAQGALFVGTIKGLIELKSGSVRLYQEAPGELPFNKVIDMVSSKSGGVWVLTHADGHGLSYVSNGEVRTINDTWLKEFGARSVAEDADGHLWIIAGSGLARFDPETGLIRPSSLAVTDREFHDVLVDDRHRVWVGADGGVYVKRRDQWEWIPFDASFLHESAHRLSTDRDGAIWISTNRGIVCINRRDQWIYYPFPKGHETNYCYEVFQDREGHHWFGTRSNGLHRIRHPYVTVMDHRDGLPHDSIWSVFEGLDHSLWIGTGGGLSRLKDGRFDNWSAAEGLPRNWVTSVCETMDGVVWVGMRTSPGESSDASCIWRLLNDKFEPVRSELIQQITRVWTVFEDDESNLWIGTRNGLFECPNGDPEQIRSVLPFENKDVRVVAEDQQGDTLVGGNGFGVMRRSSGQWHNLVDVSTGLSNNNVWAMHVDREWEDVLWIGTERGLNRYQNGQLHHFGQEQGLFDDLVNQILEDDDGNLWISCNRGVYRVAKSDLDKVASGLWDQVPHVAYGIADGMYNPETNGECQPAGCKTSSGQLVFPTAQGLAFFNPDTLLEIGEPPIVIIENLRSNNQLLYSNGFGMSEEGRILDVSNSELLVIELPPGGGNLIEFGYTATTFLAPAKTQFQYRLLGHHDDWIDVGTRRSAYYTNLHPGEYRFEVRAANHRGVWNENGASIQLNIAPHFYDTGIFYTTMILVVVVFIIGLHRLILRYRINVAHLEQQVQMNEERMRIAQDIHDEMGASLTEITMLSELADPAYNSPKEVADSVGRIKSRSSSLIQTVDEIVWTTNPRQDTLESVVAYLSHYANEFLHSASAGWQVSVPIPSEIPEISVSSETRHHLFMVTKEALNNCVRHAGASRIELHCTILNGRVLQIRIQDDGRGMPLEGSSSLTGNGLQNMKDRMNKIGGTFECSQGVEGGCQVSISYDFLQGGVSPEMVITKPKKTLDNGI
ncbi:histidine kinase [bacterium]|nr:histidine kinase [bacterium]